MTNDGGRGPDRDSGQRYSRLLQFEFADFSTLKDKSAVVVGVGGLGSVVSEIMARCGIGRLVLIDYDVLEEANLNRMLYRPGQVGMNKVEALGEYLSDVNPAVDIDTHAADVTVDEGFSAFISALDGVDAVFGCVDSFGVRLFLNNWCVKREVPLVDGGASLDGIRGSVHVVIPGETPCYRCHKLLSDRFPVGKPADPDRRTGICHFTSLPTTMTIIASLQAQEGLKLLLGFGSVAPYLMYDGMNGTLERYDWKLDPKCPVCGSGEPGPPSRSLEELEAAADEFDRLMED